MRNYGTSSGTGEKAGNITNLEIGFEVSVTTIIRETFYWMHKFNLDVYH